MYPTKLVIFDLDGTLFRTETVDIRAFNEALVKNGFPAKPDDEILDVIGLTLPEACAKLLGTSEPGILEHIQHDIIALEDRYIRSDGKLYDGVPEMLQRLLSGGYTLCICSNGNEEYVRGIADRFELDQYFEDIRYSRDGIDKSAAVGLLKSQYRAKTFVMVGDRSSDIEAAQDNGGISIGAAYGFGGAEMAAADFVAESVDEVEGFIRKCFQSSNP